MPNTNQSKEEGSYSGGARTPKDFAIEHAGYMAEAARRYLDAINAEQLAQMDDEEDGSEESRGALAAAMERASEAHRVLRNAIYEFEKRRDRALPSQSEADESTRAASDDLAAHAIEELCQLGYTVQDGQLIPPDNLHELARVAGWGSPSEEERQPACYLCAMGLPAHEGKHHALCSKPGTSGDGASRVGAESDAAPRVRWIERWYGSGPDRGWAIWEADHGDRIAYVGEGEHSERLTRLIVERHNAALSSQSEAR